MSARLAYFLTDDIAERYHVAVIFYQWTYTLFITSPNYFIYGLRQGTDTLRIGPLNWWNLDLKRNERMSDSTFNTGI